MSAFVCEAIGKAKDGRADAIDAIARRFEPKVRDAFVDMVGLIRSNTDMKKLREAVDAGDINAVFRVLGLTERANTSPFQALLEPLQELFQKVGVMAAKEAPLATLDMRFDLTAPRTVTMLQTHGANLIREISEETREGVRAVLARQLAGGLPPKKVAAEIGRLVGLTASQSIAVQNYRAALERNSRDALRRAHRDKRFDRSVNRAIEKGEKLAAEKIDLLVERYEAKMLRARGEMIAITESVRAASLANHAAMRQAVDQGTIAEAKLRRFWNLAKDEAVCPVCKGIAKLNRKGVGLEEPFEVGNGVTLMASPAHPKCRCVVTFRLRA